MYCSGVRYEGDLNDQDIIILRTLLGTSNPHYSIRLMYFVILVDTWPLSGSIQTKLISSGVFRTRAIMTSDQSDILCTGSTNPDKIFKVQAQFPHNQLNTSIQFQIFISKDILGTGVFNPSINAIWGVKQFILISSLCDQTCLTCLYGFSTICTSCLNTSFLSGQTCDSNCLTGYGPVDSSNQCILCDSLCKQCHNIATNCTSCQQYFYLDNFTCLNSSNSSNTSDSSSCTFGTFFNSNSDSCQFCHINCASCSSISTNCTSCATHQYKTLLNQCSLCNSNCFTCSNSSTNCLSCYRSLDFGWRQFSCYNPCPSGTYLNIQGRNNNCSDCNSNCLTCQTIQKCTSCQQTLYLFQNQCIQNCPSFYIKDQTYKACIANSDLILVFSILIALSIVLVIGFTAFFCYRYWKKRIQEQNILKKTNPQIKQTQEHFQNTQGNFNQSNQQLQQANKFLNKQQALRKYNLFQEEEGSFNQNQRSNINTKEFKQNQNLTPQLMKRQKQQININDQSSFENKPHSKAMNLLQLNSQIQVQIVPSQRKVQSKNYPMTSRDRTYFEKQSQRLDSQISQDYQISNLGKNSQNPKERFPKHTSLFNFQDQNDFGVDNKKLSTIIQEKNSIDKTANKNTLGGSKTVQYLQKYKKKN